MTQWMEFHPWTTFFSLMTIVGMIGILVALLPGGPDDDL